MTQTDTRGTATVPNLDARAGAMARPTDSLLARAAAHAPLALVLVGVAATVLWAGFLGWCVFYAVRWAVG